MNRTKNLVGSNEAQLITLNLVHILLIHNLLRKLYDDVKKKQGVDQSFMNLLVDMLFLFESYILKSEDQTLKDKFKYDPFRETPKKTFKN